MSGALEQSLDEIISDKKQERRREHIGRRRDGRGARRGPPGGRPGNGIPGQIFKAAEGRPMLRLKNIHPDLNGMDLSSLFVTVAPVDFVKFDPRNETVAYVCFQSNYAENNARAISRFDGKKAMGNVLQVENATSLADRIMPSQGPRSERVREDVRARESARPKENHRARAKAKQKERKPRPAPKTAEDLDKELSAYMNNSGAAEAAPEAPESGEVAME